QGPAAAGERPDGADPGAERACRQPRIPRLQWRPESSDAGAERHQSGRVLRLFERKVGARGQRAGPAEPRRRALERWRRTAAMTVKDFVGGAARGFAASALACSMLTAPLSSTAPPRDSKPRTFASAEDAVRALAAAAKAGSLDEILALFGTGGEELIASSDPATLRRNRDVFTVAFAAGWRLVNQVADRKVLVVGNEGWPFPVPLVNDSRAWRFDTAAGKEEVLARRIGRNELAVIETCRAYVAAQRRYAQDEHDGKRAGLYAMTFRSDPGRQNGLY